LQAIIPAERIRARLIDLVSFASDAGFYSLVPKAVVQPISEEEIASLFAFSQTHRIPLVFRTGGTSLSGQAITDGILVDLSQHWQKINVESNGERVRVQPGITGAMVNAHLKRFHRKIGPDPSSISAAMMGGIMSNNASGMCCGVAMNAYHTMRHVRFMLPSGLQFNTEDPEAREKFVSMCPLLAKELAEIREEILQHPALLQMIRKKYLTKNTVGYSLNAFIDHDHPLDIMSHLLIGAEGTLAFIAEAVLETVPDHPYKSTALLYFPDIYAACQAIAPLTAAGAMMVELMDRASLRAVEELKGMPAVVKTLPPEAAALLIEFQESTPEALAQRVADFTAQSGNLSMLNAPEFTTDPKAQDFLWKVRKGLFPAVGAVRKSGTTVVLEDIAFPVSVLGDAILDLQALFAKYQYDNAIIFGHAKDGNIHFVVTQSFNTQEEIQRYDAFLKEVVELTVNKHGGTLKAEHGTGRNMAPFVETEWGGDAYAIMQRIKQAVDPHNLLNPGVIINPDADAHIRNLKALPTVEEEVDRCIECGYCEHKCPSKDITATPRRRIVIRRVLEDMKAKGNREDYQTLVQQYQYEGLDTCAVDGLCATACPVDINTGDLVKRLRRENHSPSQNRIAVWVANHFGSTMRLVRFALGTGHMMNKIFGKHTMNKITKGIRKLAPAVPEWIAQIPAPPALSMLRQTAPRDASIVYFPSCISRMMGTYQGSEKNIIETFYSVCTKAGIAVRTLEQVNQACCSQIFGSKGFAEAQRLQAKRTVDDLWISSKQGALPIVIDVSSCAYTLHQLRPMLDDDRKQKFDRLKILDAVEFLHDMALPKLSVVPLEKHVVLHPVCALEKMHTQDKFIGLAKKLAKQVTVPMHAGCCGMAGDRGFLFPELTYSATAAEANEVKQIACDGHYSSTSTCEMAMSAATEKNYLSILYLVDASTV
jgi:D-lactate dehydrogenase